MKIAIDIPNWSQGNVVHGLHETAFFEEVKKPFLLAVEEFRAHRILFFGPPGQNDIRMIWRLGKATKKTWQKQSIISDKASKEFALSLFSFNASTLRTMSTWQHSDPVFTGPEKEIIWKPFLIDSIDAHLCATRFQSRAWELGRLVSLQALALVSACSAQKSHQTSEDSLLEVVSALQALQQELSEETQTHLKQSLPT